jgi:hypothetical protein
MPITHIPRRPITADRFYFYFTQPIARAKRVAPASDRRGVGWRVRGREGAGRGGGAIAS